MNAIKDVMVEARSLLEKGHIKGAYAVDKNGAEVNYLSENACAFCLSGALQRAIQDKAPEVSLTYFYRILYDKVGTSLVKFNDHPSTTKEDVVTLLDTAIASCDNP